MPAPILISYTATSTFITTTTPKTVSITVKTGDIIVVAGVSEAADATLSTPTDTVNTYAAQETVDSAGTNEAVAMLWTTTATTDASLTVSGARTGGAREYGFGVWVWRQGSIGAHASNGPNGGTAGAPSQALTTGAASSALCVAVADWNAADGTTRTWRTVNGAAAIENSYQRDAAAYTIYLGYHPDAGVAGSKTVGLTAPSTQKFSMVALEILGIPFPELTVARFAQ